MNIFLSAIIFSFFAVFAPTSHGDRPLLHADRTNGEIAYSDFKLPLARLQTMVVSVKIKATIVLSVFLIASDIFNIHFNLQKILAFIENQISLQSCPFIFCEILQV